MKKIWALLLFVSFSAMSVEVQKDPCEPFAQKFCAGLKTHFAISKCLVAKGKEISPECKSQMVEKLNKSNPCSIAVLNFCPNATEFSAVVNIECLTKNVASVPASCQNYLKARGQGVKKSANEFATACETENAKHCPGVTDSALLGDCMHKAYVANKVVGECKAVMDKYAAMRKKKPSR